MKFYIVDVFAEKPYNGNQLAVFRNAAHLSQADKQRIATEINFAESTFLLAEEPTAEGYPVEIFTPESEVPFAGHPTLGTAFIIHQFLRHGEANLQQIHLNLKVGSIPVDFHYVHGKLDSLAMQQKEPTFGMNIPPESIAAALGLDVSDIRTDYPIQEVSTGLPYLVVPLKSLAAVRAMRLQSDTWRTFLTDNQLHRTQRPSGQTVSCYAFCPEAEEAPHDLHARMFWYENGHLLEDAATGSAAGCLLAYLLQHRYGGQTSFSLSVEQGYEMKRPSLIQLDGRTTGDRMEIRVGGRVHFIASGEWN